MNIQLKTSCGIIEGIDGKDYHSYLGIKYANANRFELPSLVTKWDGVYHATRHGSACIQRRTFTPESEDSFYFKEFRRECEFTYSEDCHYLNIWTPKGVKNAPVILYIHGGAFQGGAGNELPFDGKHFAQKGIIFATCNYRLGPLGFASQILEGKTIANLGLYDQLAALKWLHRNIHDFGGDPNNITLMGQSAGAMSIQQLVTSELVKPYVSKAIMTSGGGINEKFAKPQPIQLVAPFWENFRQKLAEKGKDWKNISCEELFKEVYEQLRNFSNSLDYLSPCIDGILLSVTYENLMESIEEPNIPYLLGTTKDDMLTDVLFDMATKWRKRRNKILPESAFQFYFARNLPGDEVGAWHSSDLWYTIGNFEKCWRPFTNWDKTISNMLQSYIIQFVKTGNPNHEGLEYWGTEDEKCLIITDDKMIYSRLEMM
ncbi:MULTISPECIES: carboxylesterase family protein [unclassified Facklamia]|uniref:carboxylesterase family protein n=1 Tax=Aerococcaceae TaxID=186827 RepID=UPI0013B6D327|nr:MULTISPECIES: carboxylesterase family protein [unclassified Facklamia]NEW65098.1 carboxylesterase family protein [Facklamia sp. 252]NEW68702.1 carboxylesterase family protein [Facklamia sp. 253]QQD65495.1 carboxylesterase family protein [Aerococcaceae bacterium zg-252]